MWHKNSAIEECCRICHKTSPKSTIKPIKREQSEYFLIPYHNRERICTICVQKYDVFKNSPFHERSILAIISIKMSQISATAPNRLHAAYALTKKIGKKFKN